MCLCNSDQILWYNNERWFVSGFQIQVHNYSFHLFLAGNFAQVFLHEKAFQLTQSLWDLWLGPLLGRNLCLNFVSLLKYPSTLHENHWLSINLMWRAQFFLRFILSVLFYTCSFRGMEFNHSFIWLIIFIFSYIYHGTEIKLVT